MSAQKKQGGFIKYIILFIVLVVLIAMFDIDVKKIIEHPFVQEVWRYIKITLAFIISAFDKVFGEFQKDEVIETVASTTREIIQMASTTGAN